jgi:predicted nucleic acid-binding protein
VNASPIISLSKINRVNLLSKLCDEIIIPQGVADEINQGESNDSAVIWLREAGYAFIQASPKINLRVASWDLGLGESQVLSQAIERADYEAIIDDLAARKAAKILRVPVRGTLAVVVLAKQLGYVVSVREELENLVQVGLRVSPALLQQVLVLAGE